MKTSKAFAAFRSSLSMHVAAAIAADLVPQFNAEIVDIKKKFDETITFATTEAPTDNARNKLIDLAHADKKARILDLIERRKQELNKQRMYFLASIQQKLQEYGATVVDETENEKPVRRATFPDGSQAKVPQNLFVNYEQFQRV